MSSTSKRKYPRGILTLSDVHLGHPKTPAPHTLEGLRLFFDDFKLKGNFDQLEAILIAGDLWHKMIGLGHESVPSFIVFWHRFMYWANAKNIVVRLLRGTPLHDETQGKTVAAWTAATFPTLDFRYIDDIEIEQHEKLGLSILYVPDEARPSAELIYRDVMKCLSEHGMASVDIACMHGMFEFQLGDIPMSHHVHDSTAYEQIVKYWGTIGHIHTASQMGKFYAQGSFDRTAHGEEGPKGAYYFTELSLGHWEAIFLENKHALRYESYRATKKDEASIHPVEKWLASFKPGEHARIVMKATHPLVNAVEELSKRFPMIHVTRKIEKEKPVKKKQEKAQASVTLNKQTLIAAIMGEVAVSHPMPERDLKQLEHLLISLQT